jgi:hypothetical protein
MSKRKTSYRYPLRNPATDNRISDTCNLCGRVLDSPLAKLAHVLSEHPREFVESRSGQNLLYKIQRGAFQVGEFFGRRLYENFFKERE